MDWLRTFRNQRLDARDARAPARRRRDRAHPAARGGSEKHHSGEIRVCIEAGLPVSYVKRDAPPRERAVMMFSKLRVWDTEYNNGVLIYLLLAEHAIEIVADRGVARHVDAAEWQRIAGTMSAAFKAGQFEAGLNQAIDAVDALLAKHYPLAPGETNPNELPDAPYLR